MGTRVSFPLAAIIKINPSRRHTTYTRPISFSCTRSEKISKMSVIFRAISRTRPALVCRSFHVSSTVQDDAFSRFMFGIDGYNKIGILHDDLYSPEVCPIAAEAVRRLSEEQQMQRIYRSIRAHQLGVTRSILPKEEWTKYEDDNFYLQPYLDEVIKEMKEIEDWEANH